MRTIKCGTHELQKSSVNLRFEFDVDEVEGGKEVRKETIMATNRCCLR